MHDSFWGHFFSSTEPHVRRDLKRIRWAQNRAKKRVRATRTELRAEVEELRGQVEFLSLTLTSLIAQLDHTGAVTREDLREVMMSVDEYDGKLDARLPVAALEELLQPPVLEEMSGSDEGDDAAADPE